MGSQSLLWNRINSNKWFRWEFVLIGPIDTWNQIGQFENKIFVDLMQTIVLWPFYFHNNSMDESTFKQEDFSVEGQPPACQQVRGGGGSLQMKKLE